MTAPTHCPHKDNNKFEIVTVKIFSLKQKANQILSATIEKIKFFLFRKTVYGSFKQGITMEKCKTKAIQADLTIFPHIQAYSHLLRDNQAHSGIIQAYPGIFRTLPGVFSILTYSEPESYLEPWYIQNPVNIYDGAFCKTTIMIFTISTFHFLYFVKKICIF